MTQKEQMFIDEWKAKASTAKLSLLTDSVVKWTLGIAELQAQCEEMQTKINICQAEINRR